MSFNPAILCDIESICALSGVPNAHKLTLTHRTRSAMCANVKYHSVLAVRTVANSFLRFTQEDNAVIELSIAITLDGGVRDETYYFILTFYTKQY